eukprot:jgi/Astpho2/3654/Aster-07856
MSDTASEQGEEQELDISNSDVVSKYKAAAKIANSALASAVSECQPGAKIVDICTKTDKLIEEATAREFKGKNIEKGIAFPTCLSVNSIVGHFSPQADDSTRLAAGDMVKIDLGVYIDGWISTGAHTVVLPREGNGAAEGSQEGVSGPAADVLAAAQTAFDAALRLIWPGKRISDVAGPLQQVVESFGCQLVEGVLTHEQKRFVLDGNKCVLNRPGPDARVDDHDFLENEVYAVDIVVSTGEGKTRILDDRQTTVFKRAVDEKYQLKLKLLLLQNARQVYKEICNKYPALPFSTRSLDIQGGPARMGLVECVQHSLLVPFPVLHAKSGELVAQIKSTVLLMPNGSDR